MRLTIAQQKLKAVHGDVEYFTDRTINAIGTISKKEALDAIHEYRSTWSAAGFTGAKKSAAKTDEPA